MGPFAPMATPGTYTVRMSRRMDGVLTDYGLEQTFRVESIREPALPGAAPVTAVAFQRRIAELERQVQGAGAAIAAAEKQLKAAREALLRSKVGDSTLDDEVRSLEDRLAGLKLTLLGSTTRELMGDPGPVSIKRRVDVATMGNRYSMYGPTPTHRRSVEIAEEEFAGLRSDLERLLEIDLRGLERRLESAGVPWTPGRGMKP